MSSTAGRELPGTLGYDGGTTSADYDFADGRQLDWRDEGTGSEDDDFSDRDDLNPDEPEDALEDLERNSYISGRVLDQYGMAIPGVGLVATVQGLNAATPGLQIPVEYLQYRAISDVDGRYRFSPIVEGDYSVTAVSNGRYADAHIRVRSGTDFANIVLDRERQIMLQGRVSSTAGEPLWSALVSPLVPGVAGAYTDGHGQYQLTASISEGRGGVGIKATLSGYREQLILLNDADLRGTALNVDFTLEPVKSVAMVAGTVVSADDGLPVAGVAVEMRSVGLKQIYRSVTGEAGEFILSGVETGNDYRVLVSGGERYENFIQDQIEVSPNGLNLNVALTPVPQSSLYAQVVNLGGQSIPGFTLNMRRTSMPFNTRQVTSDGSGRFAVHGLAAGALVLERQSYPQISISGVELAHNADEHVQLVLDWGHDRLAGIVVDGAGNPVGGSTVMLTWSFSANGIESWTSRKTATDAQGNFSFTELGPGPHTLVVDAQGFNTLRRPHDVTADGYDVVVQLEPISNNTGGGS